MIYFLVSHSLGRLSFDSDDPEIARHRLVFQTEDRYAHELVPPHIIEAAKKIGRGYEWTRGVQVIEVILLPYLARGTVAFRRKEMWSNLPFEFKERPIGDVLTELRLGGFRGDYETLEALLPSKPEIEPRPNGPNVLTESGLESANTAGVRASKNVRLARAYVEWVEKLPEEDLFRLYRHGKRGACPEKAVKEFLSDQFPDSDDRLSYGRAKVNIGNGLSECPELRIRLDRKIDHARNAE